MGSGDRRYSAADGASDSFCGLVYAYGVEVRSVKTGGSSRSVFRCAMFPRSAKLPRLPSLVGWLGVSTERGSETRTNRRSSSFRVLLGWAISSIMGY
jgi:hypothetical protein